MNIKFDDKIINLITTIFLLIVLFCVVGIFLPQKVSLIDALGVGTGAADINARYIDGYGTSTTAAASKIYVSDTNGYLPQVVPTGLISTFDTSCPTGWTRISALDGKFIVGGASYSAAAGGSDSITLSTSQLPSHTHTGTTDSDGAHTHTASYGDANGLNNPNLGHAYNSEGTLTLDSSTTHTHTFTTSATGSGSSIDNRPAYATVVICKKD
jgi:hypothetical protein